MHAPVRFARRRFAAALLTMLAVAWVPNGAAQVLVSDPDIDSAQVRHIGKDAIEFGRQA